jgi:hypothetical protein
VSVTGSGWLLERLLTRPCVVHLRSEGAPDGDGVATLTDELVTTRCYAEQAAATEPGTEPEWTTQDWRVVLAAVDGLPLDGWDRVDVGGEPFEVTGGPWPVRDPHSDQVHHVELRARRAEANTDG